MDVLIVGCGLSGSIIAREFANIGKKVEIWERRNHIGGNMYDYVDEHGILVHKYGPHTFHTNNKDVYHYICKYAEWIPYHLKCGAEIDGVQTPTPFNFKTIDDFYSKTDASELKNRIFNVFGAQKTVTVVDALENTDPLIREYAQFLFDKDYSLYTAKQWGVSPEHIDPSVLKRVPLCLSYDEGYFKDFYQVMPKKNYTNFFDTLLDDENINVQLGIEALNYISANREGQLLINGKISKIPVVYTGALDELFGLCLGELPYRSLLFEWKYEEIQSKQNYPVVAYPQEEGFTRITEYKKLPIQDIEGTSYAVEYPLSYNAGDNQEPYYPVLTKESQIQYNRYRTLAEKIDNLHLCGRLADFKYYNMDQVIANALELFRIINKKV